MNLHMYILGMCTFVCVCMYMEWVSNNQSIDRSIDRERERERVASDLSLLSISKYMN